MSIHQRFVKSEVDLEHCEICEKTKIVLCGLHFRKFNKTRYSENPSRRKTPNAG